MEKSTFIVASIIVFIILSILIYIKFEKSKDYLYIKLIALLGFFIAGVNLSIFSYA